jgi:hypothetical protein
MATIDVKQIKPLDGDTRTFKEMLEAVSNNSIASVSSEPNVEHKVILTKEDGTEFSIDFTNYVGSTGTAYTLPTASDTVLGGVKVDGSTITIDGSGVISSNVGSSGSTTFLGLSDTPSAFMANKLLKVNSTSNAIELVDEMSGSDIVTAIDTELGSTDWKSGSTAVSMTDAEIKTAYENNSDTNAFTDAEKLKLSNITDKFKGLYADSTARNTGVSSPIIGDYVLQNDTNTIWYYDGSTWINTGSTSIGDMLKAVYDPNNRNKDVFAYDNATSGLTATTIQDAIDEVASTAGSGGSSEASSITYDNSSSDLTATTIQNAIDELAGSSFVEQGKIKSKDVDLTGLSDGDMVVYDLNEDKFVVAKPFELPKADDPILSGVSSSFEGIAIEITIDNHSSYFSPKYDISVTDGNAVYNGDGTISWTLPPVDVDELHTISVSVEDAAKQRSSVIDKDIDVLFALEGDADYFITWQEGENDNNTDTHIIEPDEITALELAESQRSLEAFVYQDYSLINNDTSNGGISTPVDDNGTPTNYAVPTVSFDTVNGFVEANFVSAVLDFKPLPSASNIFLENPTDDEITVLGDVTSKTVYIPDLTSSTGWKEVDVSLTEHIVVGDDNDLVPTLTSTNGSDGGFAFSSSGEYAPYNAFADKSGNTSGVLGWITGRSIVTGYIGYKFGEPQIVNKYTIEAIGTSSLLDRTPESWQFQGSNNTTDGDDGEWVDIGPTITDQTSWSINEKRVFTVENSIAYRAYRLNITANNGNSYYIHILDIQFIEGTSTTFTHGLTDYDGTPQAPKQAYLSDDMSSALVSKHSYTSPTEFTSFSEKYELTDANSKIKRIRVATKKDKTV